MIPFVTPLGVLVLLAVLRHTKRLAGRYSLGDAAAWSLASLLLLTGSAHFSPLREDMIRMVPPGFPRPDLLVTITGVLELLGAVGLLLRRTRELAGIALALLFVAMFPANAHAARAGLTFAGSPVSPVWLRALEQLLYIALALAPAWTRHRARAAQAGPRSGGGGFRPAGSAS